MWCGYHPANCSLGNNDDVFLGPKISFASASAARQPGRGQSENSSNLDDLKQKYNRDAGEKGKDGKERNQEKRDKYGDYNAQRDLETRRSKPRGDAEGEEIQIGGRNRHTNTEREDEEERDGLAKRNGGRAKFDQPWFREGDKKDNDGGVKDTLEHRGWRERERERDRKDGDNRDWQREAKPEHHPRWMKDGGVEDNSGHTQEDFQKWKEKMRAGPPGADQTPIDEKPVEGVTPASEATPALGKDATRHIFGFGDDTAKGEAAAPELPSFFTAGEKKESSAGPRSASGAKSKSSRFAGFFSPPPAQEAAVPPPPSVVPMTEPKASTPAAFPRRNTVEDQEGFQRMMKMLRMGGATSQSPSGQAPSGSLFGLGDAPGLPAPPGLSGPPVSQPTGRDELQIIHPGRNQVPKGPAEFRNAPNDAFEREAQLPPTIKPSSQRGTLPERRSDAPIHDMVAPPPLVPQFQGRPLSQQLSNLPALPRPEPGTRDSEFLLKLMQQPRPNANDAAGYGHSGRRDPNDITALLNSFANKQPAQPPKSRGASPSTAPPGFFNDRGYGANQGIDHMLSDPMMQRHERNQPVHDERMAGPPHSLRLNALDDFPRHLQQQQPPMGEQLHQRHTQYDHLPPPPQWQQQQQHQQHQQGGRLPAQQIPHDSIPPPPGFSTQRSPAPPGFFPFPGGPPPPQAQGIQRLPPGFPNNMVPPGFPNPAQQQGVQAGQRRGVPAGPPPQQQMFEMYGDPRRGGMPQPVQASAQNGGSYQQYLKQQQQQGQGAPY